MKTAVLIGDSIAAQWFSMIEHLFPAPEWRTVVLTKSACPMVDQDFFYERIGKVYDVCSRWRDNALEYLRSISPDVIFMGSSNKYPFDAGQWKSGTIRVLDRLSPVADNVFVVVGTPRLGFHGPTCVAKNLGPGGTWSSGACEIAYRRDPVEMVRGYLQAAAESFGNVRIVDFSSVVCPEGVCRARLPDGTIVFRDSLHLTDTFVRRTVPEIRELMGPLPSE